MHPFYKRHPPKSPEMTYEKHRNVGRREGQSEVIGLRTCVLEGDRPIALLQNGEELFCDCGAVYSLDHPELVHQRVL